jgi:hypothetical protein
MAATKVLYGQTNYRINREPIDAESVVSTYSDIERKTGCATHAEGALYPGMIVAVVNDEDESLRGPYYISYESDGHSPMSYTKERIMMKSDVESYIGDVVIDVNDEIEDSIDELLFDWGHLE